MKKFTKGALITVLVLVILGSGLCATAAGIGFHYTSIPKMISEGIFTIGPNFGNFSKWSQKWSENWNESWNGNDWDDDWESWNVGNTQEYDFSAEDCANIKNLKLSVECGIVDIEEVSASQGIHIEVKYKKENSKRTINVNNSENTLEIKEKDAKKLVTNDNVHVLLQIPKDMTFETVELKNSAGEVNVDYALKVNDFSAIVGAGDCTINKDLQVSGKLYAEVDAGEIDFSNINAEKLELNAGVGEINVDYADAKEVTLDCGVGDIDITLAGNQKDYSYSIDCGVGDVEVGDSDYSGLGATKEIKGGAKTVDIDCGVGDITVDFEK